MPIRLGMMRTTVANVTQATCEHEIHICPSFQVAPERVSHSTVRVAIHDCEEKHSSKAMVHLEMDQLDQGAQYFVSHHIGIPQYPDPSRMASRIHFKNPIMINFVHVHLLSSPT